MLKRVAKEGQSGHQTAAQTAVQAKLNFSVDQPVLVVGLGNPGKEYERSRHNIGFDIVDLLCASYGLGFSGLTKFNAEIASGVVDKTKLILLKPMTYMNLSGKSVLPVCSYYKISPQNIVVIHDDIDVQIGAIKYKFGGSSAGHNGLKSIDQAVGSNYHRIRVGVGRPPEKIAVADYVLGKFPLSDYELIKKQFEKNLDCFDLLIRNRPSTGLEMLIRLDEFKNKITRPV